MEREIDLLRLFRTRMRDRTQVSKRRRAAPEAVGSVLDTFFATSNIDMQRLLETKALLAWEEFVGPDTARVAQARKIQQGRLYVQVPNPLWRQELVLAKSQILQRYQTDFPELGLKDIFFYG